MILDIIFKEETCPGYEEFKSAYISGLTFEFVHFVDGVEHRIIINKHSNKNNILNCITVLKKSKLTKKKGYVQFLSELL